MKDWILEIYIYWEDGYTIEGIYFSTKREALAYARNIGATDFAIVPNINELQ